jgi:hypothetical protein
MTTTNYTGIPVWAASIVGRYAARMRIGFVGDMVYICNQLRL